jgi:hypothetical protein
LFFNSEDEGHVFPETSVGFKQSTWCYIPEDRILTTAVRTAYLTAFNVGCNKCGYKVMAISVWILSAEGFESVPETGVLLDFNLGTDFI